MRGKTIRGAWLLAALSVLLPAVARGEEPAAPSTGLGSWPGMSVDLNAPAEKPIVLLARGQESSPGSPGYAPADPQLPIPLGSTRPEDGGLYVFGRFVMFRQTNPLQSQPVAIRGFMASDNTIPTGFQGGRPAQLLVFVPPSTITDPTVNPFFFTGFPPGTPPPTFQTNAAGNITAIVVNVPAAGPNATGFVKAGTFVGPGTPALNVKQLNGNTPYSPGFETGLGWKFRDGSSISLSWMFLAEAKRNAAATLAPPGGTMRQDLADTFLFAPVFNVPPEFAGANFKITVPTTNLQVGGVPQPSAQAAFGIWNAASIMTESFIQRFQQWDITYRYPVLDYEDYRMSALVGPRFAWFWERYQWTTTSIGVDSAGNVDNGPDNVGIYTNIQSNRLYGVHAGCQQECYLGHGFAIDLVTEAGAYMDIIKERATYETAAKFLGLPENKHARTEYNISPGFNGAIGLMYYPTEFIQIYGNYEFMAFFDTKSSRHPIDFNYGSLSPAYNNVNRYLDGFRFGVAITF